MLSPARSDCCYKTLMVRQSQECDLLALQAGAAAPLFLLVHAFAAGRTWLHASAQPPTVAASAPAASSAPPTARDKDKPGTPAELAAQELGRLRERLSEFAVRSWPKCIP